jgi:hypothetical protein
VAPLGSHWQAVSKIREREEEETFRKMTSVLRRGADDIASIPVYNPLHPPPPPVRLTARGSATEAPTTSAYRQKF